MAAGPDLGAYKEAQDRLREYVGQTVVLAIPQETTWPDGTKLDPETGRPLDPWVTPTASGYTEVEVHAAKMFRAMNRQRSSEDQRIAVGVFRDTHVVLDLNLKDFDVASRATRFTVNDVLYKVEDVVRDGLGSVQRVLVYGEQL